MRPSESRWYRLLLAYERKRLAFTEWWWVVRHGK